MAPSFVYILKCADGSYYVGCTTNLDQRIGQHKSGLHPGYTSMKLPVECVYVGEFQNIHDAISWERRLKRWSRLKKEAVIRGDYDALPELAKRGFRPGLAASFETPAAPAPQDDV